MSLVISGDLKGGSTVSAPPSKSFLHRLLICEALTGRERSLLERVRNVFSVDISNDIMSTAECLDVLMNGQSSAGDISPSSPDCLADGDISQVLPVCCESKEASQILPGCREGEDGSRIFADGRESGYVDRILLNCHESGYADRILLNCRESGYADRILLNCRESGSTLRFLLPLAAALGKNCTFIREGSLKTRPIDELLLCLSEHGAHCEIDPDGRISVSGQLHSGEFRIPGNVSSQYISGLLMALPLLEGDSTLFVTGDIVSKGYIDITEAILAATGIRFEKAECTAGLSDTAGIRFEKTECAADLQATASLIYKIPGRQKYALAADALPEGDWSNAAVFLCAGAFIPKGVTVRGLNLFSAQKDRQILDILKQYGAVISTEEAGNAVRISPGSRRPLSVDLKDIPDLAPLIYVLAESAQGPSCITGEDRLRFKESDRYAASIDMIKRFREAKEKAFIEPKCCFKGETAEAQFDVMSTACGDLRPVQICTFRDHRIAMAAALACAANHRSVEIDHPECVNKSFPGFFEIWNTL